MVTDKRWNSYIYTIKTKMKKPRVLKEVLVYVTVGAEPVKGYWTGVNWLVDGKSYERIFDWIPLNKNIHH